LTGKKGGLFSFALLAMVATHALIHAAGSMRGPMIVEVRKDFVLSNMEIGLISAIPSLASVLFTLPVGWMSDRYGARRLVALSVMMAAAGALIAGFTVSPAMYIVGLVLMTLTSTFYHPPSHSYTARMVETRDRSKAMGFLNAGGTFGVALGPLSIFVLMGFFAFQWRQVYLFWVPFIALGLVLVFFLRDMKGAGSEGGWGISGGLCWRWVWGTCSISLLSSLRGCCRLWRCTWCTVSAVFWGCLPPLL